MYNDELKKMRHDGGFSQQAFASLLGISNTYLCNIERTDGHVPVHIEERAKSVLRKYKNAEAKASANELAASATIKFIGPEEYAITRDELEQFFRDEEPSSALSDKQIEEHIINLHEETRAKNPVIPGVQPDAEIVTNKNGGMQSHVPYRFDLIHAGALFEMAKVLEYGARRYEPWNWQKIDIESHLNHLIIHAYAWLAGDRTDDHLSHIMCRAMFAQGVELEERK